MDVAEYIVAVEEYYGMRYSTAGLELRLMKQFLSSLSISLEDLFSRVITLHSKKWKSLPDIAIMKDAVGGEDSAVEAAALRWWSEITRKANALNDVVCEDIRVQQCIDAFGGWQEFCSRDPQYENLHRKEFCRLYAMYTRNPVAESPRVMRGMYQRNSMAYIGDAGKCALIERACVSVPTELIGDRMRQIAKELSPEAIR
ncbi:MAG: DUF6475 domain-containing protein [Spirochaetota bacterium]